MVANKEVTGLQRVRRHAAAMGVWLCCLAAADAEAAKRVALLIGNEKYQAHNVLENPKRDVELVAGHLRKLGFTVVAKANLKRAEMVEVIDQFIADADGAEVALFYYAGHGMQPLDGGRNYLLPIDARRVSNDSVLRADALPADGPDSVLQRLERAKTRLRLMLLDACRNNAKGRGVRSADRGLRPVMPEDQFTLVSFSTRESSPALDDVNGSTNSPYAAALAKWLPMAGHRSVRDIFDSVGEQVKAETGGDQEPAVYTTLPSNVMLSGGKRERTEAENEADAWFYASQTGSASALKAFLQEFPKGRYAAQARIRLAALQEPPPPPLPEVGQIVKDCADCPELVVLPKGRFLMGSPDSEPERERDEGPQRTVRINYTLAVGRYEITQGQWKAVMGSNPSNFSACGDTCPVENVSWDMAQEYLKKLNAKSGQQYRLLSEAEWEYAARAGTTTPFHTGKTITPQEANFDGNYTYNGSATGVYREKTVRVGSFGANAFGLHDMHGNVWEWVQDVWHDNYTGAPTDGSAWESGGDAARRVLRGGSWGNFPRNLRSALRHWVTPVSRVDVTGFRIARTF